MNLIITALISVGISIGTMFGIDSLQPKVTPDVRNLIQQQVNSSSRDIKVDLVDYMNKLRSNDTVVLGTTLPIAGSTYTLSGGGVTSSATTITLSSLTLPQNGYKITDSDLADTFFLTLEPGNRSRQEIISCTTVVQNSNNTATISGCVRGLSPISPYTASSSLQFGHAGGAQVVFSDPPQLFNKYAAKDNSETITGTWTFNSFPITPSNGTSSETIAGVVELATGAEAAAGTLTGATGARLALSTAIATSTWNSATAGNVIPVTDSVTKKINANFIATSTLGANFTLSGTSTMATSTTYFTNGIRLIEIGKNTTVITNTGTSTFTVPSGVSKINVKLVAGGGNGGDGAQTGSNCAAGGSAGAGGYAEKIVDVTGTSTIQVYVGTAGQSTMFGTNGFYFSATAGSNGSNGSGFTGGGRGSGGSGVGGDINISGGGGSVGMGAGSGGFCGGVAGGNSVLGFGGGGGNYATNGAAGSAYGGGGGSGGSQAGGSTSTGGSGAQGIIIINW